MPQPQSSSERLKLELLTVFSVEVLSLRFPSFVFAQAISFIVAIELISTIPTASAFLARACVLLPPSLTSMPLRVQSLLLPRFWPIICIEFAFAPRA